MRGCIKLTIVGFAFFSCSALSAQVTDTIVTPVNTNLPGIKPGIDTLVVTGTLKDAATGKPLTAINISVPDFSAALTDDNGHFSVRVPDYNATLFISAEGFQSKEIALKGTKIINAVLFEETYHSLFDEIILPMGVRSQNQTTQATGLVNTGGSWDRPIETVDGYLQGKVAGLQPIMRSGTPNLGAYLTLRGYNSLYTTNQPLIVVDGLLYDINDYGPSLISNHYSNALANIDLKDIENITVIKDAVSTYGTKAANGVILITTNHAKQLATKIDAAVYGGVNFVPDNLPVMNSADYRTYLSDVLHSRGWSVDKIQAQPYMNDSANPNYYRYHNNTDWQKQVFNQSSSQNYILKLPVVIT